MILYRKDTRALTFENFSQGKISCETPLHDKISSFVRLPQSVRSKAPRLLQIFEQQTGKKLGLRIKHLNVLQDFLSERIDAKVEDVLGSAYRVPLDDDQLEYLRSTHSYQQTHLRQLLRKLLKLAEMLQRNAYSPKHGIKCFSRANVTLLTCVYRYSGDGGGEEDILSAKHFLEDAQHMSLLTDFAHSHPLV